MSPKGGAGADEGDELEPAEDDETKRGRIKEREDKRDRHTEQRVSRPDPLRTRLYALVPEAEVTDEMVRVSSLSSLQDARRTGGRDPRVVVSYNALYVDPGVFAAYETLTHPQVLRELDDGE